MATASGNTSFTITLPNEVIGNNDGFIAIHKMYGTNRGEIARALILDMLKRLAGEGLVKLRGTSPSA